MTLSSGRGHIIEFSLNLVSASVIIPGGFEDGDI